MDPSIHPHHLQGRLVAVGPGEMDLVLTAEGEGAERLLAQLSLATEQRLRVEVRESVLVIQPEGSPRS
jgi:hypothetical protein